MNNFFNLRNIKILLLDFVIFSLSFYFAFWIHFEGIFPIEMINIFIKVLPILLLLRFITFFYFDLYHIIWRYIGTTDLINILKAISLSSLLLVLVIYLGPWKIIPSSVLIIDWLLALVGTSGSRIGKRFIETLLYPKSELKRVIIIGAGEAGEMIIRELLVKPKYNYKPIALVDDADYKQKRSLHGVIVQGTISDLPKIIKKTKADEIIIAIPSTTDEQMRRIIHYCHQTGKPFHTLPEMLDGTVSIRTMRNVQVEDLLKREPIELETEKIANYLKNKSILITGAGGSIGSELSRQIINFQPSRLLLYENSEYNLYEIDRELKKILLKKTEIIPLLGDINDRNRLEAIMRKFKPDAIFHAAAYKHVPMIEYQPEEAIKNNIIGTKILAEVADKYNIKRFVLVSTDKAVNPTAVMGASKRLTELFIQYIAKHSKSKFMIVRFGNVLDSTGSIIPLFREQIASGGPVTITHKDIMRYFMTIPEAAQLILQAGVMGKGGEIFVLDMGKQVKILDLAKDLIILSGLEPNKDIKIEFIGLRPGEKLYEELIGDGEGYKPTYHKKIMIVQNESAYLEHIEDIINELKIAADEQNGKKIKMILAKCLKEYKPSELDDLHF